MAQNFYMTLPSNSSMAYFPSNTMAEFTTKLPKEVNLTGQWSVGLSDIMFPKSFAFSKTFFDVYSAGLQSKDPGGEAPPRYQKRYTTEDEYFPSNYHFIEHLNALMKADSKSPQVQFKVTAKDIVSIKLPKKYGVNLSDILKKVLGFAPDTTMVDFYNSGQHKGAYSITGTKRMDLGSIPTIYVYADIIEPTIVGDKLAQLLDVIAISDDTKQKMCSYRVEKPRYVPLQAKNIAFPKISLMTDLGTPVPFVQGRVIVKLHFKKLINV